MKKLLLGLICIASLCSIQSSAQRKCGQQEALLKKMQNDPEMRAKYEAYQKQQALQAELGTQGKSTQSTAAYNVPVVFHIVLTAAQQSAIGGTAGITKRIDSQIVVLNRDYQKKNSDSTKIPAVFKPLYGNANINFSLAHRKPGGQATPGYEIITTTAPNFDGTGGTVGSQFSCSDVKYTQTGGAASWDPTKYLNIWICAFDDASLLGIAYPKYFVTQFGLPLAEVGVVVSYDCFGKRASSGELYKYSVFDRGRTATHEIGHYFGLDHIWGQNDDCAGTDDDNIGDTPKQDKANSGCPAASTVYANCASTAGGEMWMNYMDYVDDACMVMFSNGQVTKMQATYPTTLTSDPSIFQWPTEVGSVEIDNPFEIYPNPTNGKINVSFAKEASTLQNIVVTNVMGQQVQNVKAETNTGIYNIDISNMSKGIYFVQCHFAEGVVTRKIVLE